MHTKLLLAGDLMTGRGIDQIMPHPCHPQLYEASIHDARDYVRLAEQAHGPIPSSVGPDYIWGDALDDIDAFAPDARLVNLETAVTDGGRPWKRKDVHYRMNPAHLGCLAAARVDVCALANNHILDWGNDGLSDTLSTLRHAGFATAGAGRNAVEAGAPAMIGLPRDRRLLVFAFAAYDCGVPPSWEADHSPGVNMLPPDNVHWQSAARRMLAARRPGDLVVVSIHWGPNWVGAIPANHRRAAHFLVESGAADLIHGHSSHHPLPAEVHRGKLILYGCGDLINDYEGITPDEGQRTDLVCLYAATLDDDGMLSGLEVMPYRLRRFRLERADRGDREGMRAAINRRSGAFGTELVPAARQHWQLAWHQNP